jgi:hypothetical protein
MGGLNRFLYYLFCSDLPLLIKKALIGNNDIGKQSAKIKASGVNGGYV